MNRQMKLPNWLPISLIGLLALAGCATPATHQSMVPANLEGGRKHLKTVSVAASGGRETVAIDKPQISNDTLAKALTEAITKAHTFSRVVEGNAADYLLAVHIFSIEQPSFGLSFSVKMEAGWTLTRTDTKTVVWQEAIKSEYTATPGDAFAAAVRLRLATEGAARNNIAEGLAKISSMQL